MANDVTIVVEASLGDTLLKLELAKRAIGELDDAGTTAGRNLGDDSNRRSFSSRIGNLRRELSNIGDRGPLGAIVRGFGNLASAMLAPIDLGMKFAQNFERIGSVGQGLVGVLVALPTAFLGLAAAIAVVTFAATALADIMGTLVAVAADFVAPLTLVAGLLGGLGLAFGIAAKRAADGGGKLSEFSQKLDMLKSMFGRTSDILAHVFLPYLLELAGAAEKALNFLDKIVKLPLREAFHAIDTQGMHMLGQFVDRVAEVLAKPIRLAFHIAFDDQNFAGMVSDWWHRFTAFLFGETESHPIKLHKKTIGFEENTVDGIFQPLIDWFNRHHFTRQGIGIGREILRGVLNSGMRHRISAFIVDIFKDSARNAGRAFIHTLNQPLGPVLLDLVKRGLNAVTQAWSRADQEISNSIKNYLGKAWDWVKTKAHSIWSAIIDFLTSPISINIDWPSPPAWLTDWLGGGAGGGDGPIHPGPSPHPGGSGGPPHPSYRTNVRRTTRAGGNVIVVHAGPLDSLAARRKTAGIIDRSLQQRWSRSGY